MGPHWRRTSRGWYVPGGVDGSIVEQRIIEQAARLPRWGWVTGWAALRLFGARYFDGLAPDGRTRWPVPLIVGSRIRADDGIVVSQEQVPLDEQTEACGVRCVVPERALFDEVRRRGTPRQATIAIDTVAAAGLVPLAGIRAYIDNRYAWRAVELARQAVRLATEDCASPRESWMRLVWMIDAQLPAPLCNQPVYDAAGLLVGFPDLLDAEAGVVGEYDGADHRSGSRHRHDVARESRFRDLGLECFTVVTGDPIPVVVRRMHAARRRAAWVAPGQRGWVVGSRPHGLVQYVRQPKTP